MLEVYQRLGHDAASTAEDVLCLPYDQRKRGRLKAVTENGEEIGLFLERGAVLRDGELLKTECGKVIQVHAADEEVTTAASQDWNLFARACYHLGNRHVPLQIGARWLRFQRDPVLQALVTSLGMEVRQEHAPFDPEPGVYGKHTHHRH
jgi:urease accessory protein